MSQEMNILCCYSCKMFQVHIVKKAKKWQCKICNEKQSFQQVYFKGSGKDCRTQVQYLNSMRNNECQASSSFHEDNSSDNDCENDYTEPQEVVVESKWTKYLDSAKKETEVETLVSIDNDNSSSTIDNDDSKDNDDDESTYIYSENDSIDDSYRSEDNHKPKFNILLNVEKDNVETEIVCQTFDYSCNGENTSSFKSEGGNMGLKRKNVFDDEEDDDDDFNISIDF